MSAAEYRARIPEKAFQRQVENMATLHGWWTWHDEDSRRNTAGLPDLICIHPRHGVVWIELKTEKGKVRDAQRDILLLLRKAGQRAFIARPRHSDALERLFFSGDVPETAFELPEES